MIGPIPNPESGPEGAATPSVNVWVARGRRAADWAMRIAEFAAIQALVQLVLASAGILIVRTLPKNEYALFAIANSIQVAGNALADLGIGIGLRSIGGRVWNDRVHLGELVATALSLRYRFALLAGGVCLPVAAWMLMRNGASVGSASLLCALIVLGIMPLLGISAWLATAQLHGEYRRIQKLDCANAFLRLALIGGFALTRLNAALAFFAGTLTNWLQEFVLRGWAREKFERDPRVNPDFRRELVALSLRSLPNTVFYCLQGQVTIFILSWLGNPTGVADLTALGRIAVLFTVFSTVFANLLGPRFARCQEPRRIPKLYLLLTAATICVLGLLVLMALLFPKVFLWLLGSKYSGLENECVWVVGAASLGSLGTTMWNLNSSKAWIGAQVRGFIPAVVGIQVVAACFLNLTRFHDVLIFNLVICAAPLPVYAIDAILGMRRLQHGRPQQE